MGAEGGKKIGTKGNRLRSEREIIKYHEISFADHSVSWTSRYARGHA